jgi:hypothetical protein
MKVLKNHAQEAVETYASLPGEVKRSIAITLCKLAHYEGEQQGFLKILQKQSEAEGWLYLSTMNKAADGTLKPQIFFNMNSCLGPASSTSTKEQLYADIKPSETKTGRPILYLKEKDGEAPIPDIFGIGHL